MAKTNSKTTQPEKTPAQETLKVDTEIKKAAPVKADTKPAVKTEEKKVEEKKAEEKKPAAEVKAEPVKAAEPAKTEKKPAEKKADSAKAAEKKPAARKPGRPKKTEAARKPGRPKKSETAKKPGRPAKKPAIDVKPDVFVQFAGSEYSEADMMKKVVDIWEAEGKKATAIKRVKLYVKPEDGKAYFVINEGLKNGSTGAVDL